MHVDCMLADRKELVASIYIYAKPKFSRAIVMVCIFVVHFASEHLIFEFQI